MNDVLKTGGFRSVYIYIKYYQLYRVKGTSLLGVLGGGGGRLKLHC
jgi:hypothetical protein